VGGRAVDKSYMRRGGRVGELAVGVSKSGAERLLQVWGVRLPEPASPLRGYALWPGAGAARRGLCNIQTRAPPRHRVQDRFALSEGLQKFLYAHAASR